MTDPKAHPSLRGPRAWLKRGVDVVVSSAALAAASPIILGAAGLIALQMGRPVLFKQQRPGLNGEPFMLLKFRTMLPPKPGRETADDAQRLTRLGQWLRKTSVDELPTLINVLRGDMSLVGPRPLLMQYLRRYSPTQQRRHEVKPGVTGWAQVNGRNALDWNTKFALDVWYVDHWSLALDVKVLVKTALVVLKRSDTSHGGQATMHEFMGESALAAGVGDQGPHQA
jgi:sugar transferase EpsL